MVRARKHLLLSVYALATVQFAWCYLWLTRPYINTLQYEQGVARMPFQGRCLMMLPMRWAHGSLLLARLTKPFALSHFWFPRPVQAEVLMQALINIACLLIAGVATTRIYQASSRTRLLTPLVYPLLLVLCGATYVMHTVQNFRFIYDLPSLAFFSVAMYLLYFRRHRLLFAALFLVATINRETTLLLLPLAMINDAVIDGRFRWQQMLRARTLLLVVPLAALWLAWQILVRRHFAHNLSEFYPRFDWNFKSLLVPQAWPQLLSACGYLLPLVVRRRIADPKLQAWLWLLPLWLLFMFCFGILIETRIYGELIPLVVCASMLILEETLVRRMEEQSLDEPGSALFVESRPRRTGQAA